MSCCVRHGLDFHSRGLCHLHLGLFHVPCVKNTTRMFFTISCVGYWNLTWCAGPTWRSAWKRGLGGFVFSGLGGFGSHFFQARPNRGLSEDPFSWSASVQRNVLISAVLRIQFANHKGSIGFAFALKTHCLDELGDAKGSAEGKSRRRGL
jgi:hypothetical protein